MEVHQTQPVQVWVDVDEGIVEAVVYLNTLAGVRTHASCQGTRRGRRPYVMATWTAASLEHLQQRFDVAPEGDNWGYVYPRLSG